MITSIKVQILLKRGFTPIVSMNFSTSFVSPASDRPSWRKKQCLSHKYLIYYKKEKHFDFLGSNIKKLSIPWQDLLHLLGGLLLFLDAVRRKNFDRSHVHTATFALIFFSYSQCNICISWRISCTGKMQQKNWQIKIVLLVLTDRHVRGKVGRYLPWLGLLLPLIRGAADKVELYFYLHFISLYLYFYRTQFRS